MTAASGGPGATTESCMIGDDTGSQQSVVVLVLLKVRLALFTVQESLVHLGLSVGVGKH